MKKTITIDEELWKKLTRLKIDKGFKTINDVIKNLIKEENGTI